MSTLAVIPIFLRSPADLQAAIVTLETLRAAESGLEILVVDDGSPAPALVDEVEAATSRLNAGLHRKEVNEGFSRTVNVGLAKACSEGKNALLVNADMEFRAPFLAAMEDQPRADGKGLAEVVGARLLYPNGLIQHGGIYFSLLNRQFDHRFHFAPGDLPEAMFAAVCPVTGALQFIRFGTLATVGLYDAEFRMSMEDVDYCLRVFEAGGQCVYQPLAWAYHYESMFRGQPSPVVQGWEAESRALFRRKWASRQAFQDFIPTVAA